MAPQSSTSPATSPARRRRALLGGSSEEALEGSTGPGETLGVAFRETSPDSQRSGPMDATKRATRRLMSVLRVAPESSTSPATSHAPESSPAKQGSPLRAWVSDSTGFRFAPLSWRGSRKPTPKVSPGPVLPSKASSEAPPPSFAKLIAAGTVVPDERDGPYALGSYHANVAGKGRGYTHVAGRREWFATNKAIMARQTSWAIDVDHRQTSIP